MWSEEGGGDNQITAAMVDMKEVRVKGRGSRRTVGRFGMV